MEIQLWCDAFTGGFGAHPDHDAHVHPTLSAIQILIMQDALDRVDIPRVVKCIVTLSFDMTLKMLMIVPLSGVLLLI